jgi:hypothetical protein
MIYVRYRWGYLSIRVSQGPTTDVSDAVNGEEVFGMEHGEGLDGTLEYEELTKISKDVIVWPGKCKDEPGPLYIFNFAKEHKNNKEGNK